MNVIILNHTKVAENTLTWQYYIQCMHLCLMFLVMNVCCSYLRSNWERFMPINVYRVQE